MADKKNVLHTRRNEGPPNAPAGWRPNGKAKQRRAALRPAGVVPRR